MSENVKVAKAAGIVGSATLASRVMGYIRDMVMSWIFGTSLAADAFYVAYRIPNLLRELLAEGSMSAAFIPVFTETLTKESRESARHLANAVFARLLMILVVLTGLGIIFAPYVVKMIALGWEYRVEYHDKYLLVNVTLTLTTEHDAVVVPAPTVQTGQDGTYVFVVKPDSTVDYRPVKIARTEGQDAVVTSGLEPGERVVTTGFVRLAPGITVAVEDAAPAAERIGDAQ